MKSPLLVISLAVMAAGILVQAIRAGVFISGRPGARMAHVVVGAILPYAAIVPMVSAWRLAGRKAVSKGVAIGATILFVGLWARRPWGTCPSR